MKTLLMFLSVAILSGCGGGLVTQQKMVEQIKTLKEEVKLLKQENQRLQKIVEQIKTWIPSGFHMQLGIADKKEN